MKKIFVFMLLFISTLGFSQKYYFNTYMLKYRIFENGKWQKWFESPYTPTICMDVTKSQIIIMEKDIMVLDILSKEQEKEEKGGTYSVMFNARDQSGNYLYMRASSYEGVCRFALFYPNLEVIYFTNVLN